MEGWHHNTKMIQMTQKQKEEKKTYAEFLLEKETDGQRKISKAEFEARYTAHKVAQGIKKTATVLKPYAEKGFEIMGHVSQNSEYASPFSAMNQSHAPARKRRKGRRQRKR